MERRTASGAAPLRPMRPRSAGLPPNYTTAVLAAVGRRSGHLLPAGARFFDIALPAWVGVLLAREWRDRWLGYSTPPGWKVDGEPQRGVTPERKTADLDGVWDFRPEFGLLLVRSPGHHALTDQDFGDKRLAAALGGRGADVAGCTRWLEEQARRWGIAARSIVDLHEHARTTEASGPVRVDPESVLLPAGTREELLREVDLFCSGEAWYAAEGLPWRRGIMLYGPPGNGKTTAARMVASRMLDRGGAAFAFSFCRQCDDGDLAAAFERASKAAPAVLILEDVDALHEAYVTRGCLLGLLDGTAGGARGVFTVASTNYPEQVDPALVGRAGRFDRAVHLPAPDAGTRHAYLGRWWAGRPQAALLDAAVAATDGLSIAACNEVRYFVALRLRDGTLPAAHELEEFVAGLRRAEEARRDRAWARGRLGFAAGE